MFDRQLLGDVILALAIAIPTAALAAPEATPQRHVQSAAVQPAKAALASAADRQIGLFR